MGDADYGIEKRQHPHLLGDVRCVKRLLYVLHLSILASTKLTRYEQLATPRVAFLLDHPQLPAEEGIQRQQELG
ncbi:MAG: hypothetical protein ACUVX8_11565 [Candidatus Zipacnadales bacterium]